MTRETLNAFREAGANFGEAIGRLIEEKIDRVEYGHCEVPRLPETKPAYTFSNIAIDADEDWPVEICTKPDGSAFYRKLTKDEINQIPDDQILPIIKVVK